MKWFGFSCFFCEDGKKKTDNVDKNIVGLFLSYWDDVLEHLWIVVVFVLSWLFAAVAARTSRTSVIAARTAVTSAVITAWCTLTVVTTRTSVSTWLALRLYIAFRLFDECLA